MESLFIATGLASFALGAAMTLFGWSIVRENRRREAARVELLSGMAFPDGVPVAATAVAFEVIRQDDDVATDEFLSERTTAPESLFREPPKSGAASRRTIALAAVCVVMAIVVSTSVWFIGASASAASAPAATPVPATLAAPTPPAAVTRPEPRVELLALDHSATPAGLVVTGRLRNPANGASLHDVVAVVDVLDRAGRVLTTARASIGRAVLNAGEWSDFSVAAAKTTNVARYRVEFHAREREPVPQIDLRPAGPNSRSE